MRIDKLLWFLRFAKTRTIAQTMAESGHIRCNGRRVERAHQRVAAGDVLVVPLPAGEAQTCYRTLDEARVNPVAPPPIQPRAEGDPQP
jgi:ribosome-associated heat shock protein Hsp15